MKKNILVISAPSGGGKTSVINHILSDYPIFNFSISTTTRPKRTDEIHGQHYYFINNKEFQNKIHNNDFIEFEKIFNNYYGTQHQEIQRILNLNKIPIFDIDVKGAYAIQKHYPNNSLLIFLKPPSLDILKQRLTNRNTETNKEINLRLQRAELEINMSNNFNYILINDNLEQLLQQIHTIIKKYFFQ